MKKLEEVREQLSYLWVSNFIKNCIKEGKRNG